MIARSLERWDESLVARWREWPDRSLDRRRRVLRAAAIACILAGLVKLFFLTFLVVRAGAFLPGSAVLLVVATSLGNLVVWAVLAGGCVRARRLLTRLLDGRCVRCGYDLRQSADRCPECGRPIDDPRPHGPPSDPASPLT